MFLIDLVKVTLLNGNERQDCDGNRITIAIHGKTQEGSDEVCSTNVKQQILGGNTGIWYPQDLGSECKKTLFDPDSKIEVQVLTYAAKGNGFCPKKVELEIFDIASNKLMYFCSKMKARGGVYKAIDNHKKHVAKEERCISN